MLPKLYFISRVEVQLHVMRSTTWTTKASFFFTFLLYASNPAYAMYTHYLKLAFTKEQNESISEMPH